MAEVKLTLDQQAVVDHRGGGLLVSAAAGSGKTKVLVDRLLRRVCDDNDPCNVDDFLIITFTQAAAAELRSKISKEISKRLAERSDNRHLRRQMNRIYLAQISTVHSFCTAILRQRAHLLDIPADFRVAEETEAKILRQQAVEELLENLYDDLDAEGNIEAFLESLGFGRNDRKIMSLILETYNNVQSHAWPEQWMQTCKAYMDTCTHGTISNTVWGEYLLQQMRKFLTAQIGRMEFARSLLVGSCGLEVYEPAFESDLGFLRSLLEDLTWERLNKADTYEFPSLKPVRNYEDQQLKNRIQNIRKTCKEQLKKRLRAFSVDADTAMGDLKTTQKAMQGLLELTCRFSDLYRQKKRRRRVLDFSDLEHEAIRLLVDPYTGGPTKNARELSEKYREIMVDEYQDTNEVQDAIFSAVSRKGENLFMVGDVKQSIYRFRLADPGIFLRKYHDFTLTDDAFSKLPRKILLSENFRSRPQIVEAVNHVFSCVMSEEVGDINYGEEEKLRTNRTFADLSEPCVELHCISTEDSEEFGRREQAEAEFVAAEIWELVNGEHYISDENGLRRIRQEDVVILARSLSTAAPIYAEALRNAGLTPVTDRNVNILDTTEVSAMLAFLSIVDNPHRDIPLLTALSSPVGGFTADELTSIRSVNRHVDFYDALCLSAENMEKAKSFLDMLTDLRQKCPWLEPVEFYDYLAEKTGAENIFSVMSNGEARLRNVRRLRSLCLECSAMGIGSIGGFLRHINHLREQGIAVTVDQAEVKGVAIMSIHKSKGLEFPVVFLCDLARKFNTEEEANAVRTDSELMMGCNVVDKTIMAQYPGTAKFAINLKKHREMVSEELRLLYVAMTRAKDRLIMTCCEDKMENRLQKTAELADYPTQSSISAEVASLGGWVLLAAAVRPEASHLFGGAVHMTEKPEFTWKVCFHQAVKLGEKARQGQGTFQSVASGVQNCLKYRSEAFDKMQIPAKLTATQLKGRGLDEESAEGAGVGAAKACPEIKLRLFHPEEKSLTSAQKGTAMHLFMQYCNYGSCQTKEGIREEKKRLLEKEFLTEAQIEAVSSEKLLRFFQSELGRTVAQSKGVHREFKFSILTDAAAYYPVEAGEKVLFQGVVDCFLVTENGIVVLDFKTDRLHPGQERARAEYYKPQLQAYSQALERIYSMPVVRRVVYFFSTDTACDV